MTTYTTELPANILASMVGDVLEKEGIVISSRAQTKVAVMLARNLTPRTADVCPDCAGKGIVKDGFGVLFECSRCRGSGQRG